MKMPAKILNNLIIEEGKHYIITESLPGAFVIENEVYSFTSLDNEERIKFLGVYYCISKTVQTYYFSKAPLHPDHADFYFVFFGKNIPKKHHMIENFMREATEIETIGNEYGLL